MLARPDYLEWLDRAKRDLETAEFLFRAEHYTDVICFHAHQAVEKSLKALLCRYEKLPPKTHNIDSLLGGLGEKSTEFTALKAQASRITSYYIESRYPAQLRSDCSREEVEKALKIAREVYGIVERECQ